MVIDKKKVVVTGMGIISPIGIGLDNYWQALTSGKSGTCMIDRFDTTDFTTKIAAQVNNFNPLDYLDKKRVRKTDRFVQFAIAAAQMAKEDAEINFDKIDKDRVGVVMGSGIGGLNVIEQQKEILMNRGPKKISPYFIPMLITNIAPGEIAINYGLRGVNYAVSSACASANHGIGAALRSIQYGEADVIITGGTEAVLMPLGVSGFCALKALSTRNDDPKAASRPFDKNRDGFVMGEGAGILILESEEHAKKRDAKIYAELAGYWATDDAYHITAPNPEGIAAAKCLENAIKDAGLNLEDIDYINAHGTSTYFNDKTETHVFKQVFADLAPEIPISSTKSMTGHLLGAAGAAELIASILTIKTGTVHPTINYQTPDTECDLDYVPNIKRENQDIKAVISNSLGFGGHNATLVAKKYE
ncbi:MAG: beta-ketoacyl-ACP synthase II [bacterium]|nr:beta-ketoacyl-ACP synthase II [bacterium]